MKPKNTEQLKQKKKLLLPAALAVAVVTPILATHLAACGGESDPPTADAGTEDVVEEPIV